MDQVRKEYTALTAGAGFARMGPRDQIEVTGEDRATLLNNFCTNDVQGLAPNSGTEAFILDVKGKVLGHVFIYCGEQSLVIETTPGQAEKLIKHLDRYVITEDVQLNDVSDGWSFLFVGGAEAQQRLESLTSDQMPTQQLDFITTLAGTTTVAIGRGGAISPRGYTMCVREEDLSTISEALREGGFAECGEPALQAVRIEAGMPLYGRDITEDNLPQEVNRNAQAINFNKGCYLGQETVARIDALGHVNRLLMGVKLSGAEIPSAPMELMAGDTHAGSVTSAAFSPTLNAPLALAYVRSAQATPGTALTSEIGTAEVVKLPLET